MKKFVLFGVEVEVSVFGDEICFSVEEGAGRFYMPVHMARPLAQKIGEQAAGIAPLVEALCLIERGEL